MNCTCPHCGERFEVESQQKRAIRARWAKESNPTKRRAAAKRQAQARWGVLVLLECGRGKDQVQGYAKSQPGTGNLYRFKGDKEWKRASPRADLIGKVFYVYGR